MMYLLPSGLEIVIVETSLVSSWLIYRRWTSLTVCWWPGWMFGS